MICLREGSNMVTSIQGKLVHFDHIIKNKTNSLISLRANITLNIATAPNQLANKQLGELQSEKLERGNYLGKRALMTTWLPNY